MNKSMLVTAHHLNVPVSFTLNVSISDLEISELIKSKAKAKARLLGFKAPFTFGPTQDVDEQLEINFESHTAATDNTAAPDPLTGSYTSYTPTDSSAMEEEESEEESSDEELSSDEYCDALSNSSDMDQAYTPYSVTQESPPKSYHDSLRGTEYIPYRSFVVPVEIS